MENLEKDRAKSPKVRRTENDWRRILTPEQYRITRQKGTERAFTGQYYDHSEKGIYKCICCGAELFSSDAKYDSGTGWPSFYEPISEKAVDTEIDRQLLWETRTEVLCSTCGSHLGHIFNDGPRPSGKRYCVNSTSLVFEQKKS